VNGPAERWPGPVTGPPRYTGRRVWNRQHIQYRHTDTGRVRVQQWNPTDQWVVSARPAHPALVSEADFIAVQAIRSTRTTADGARRTYRLAGLLRCGICGRRLDSHWANNRPGYRCRHGQTSAHPTTVPDDRQRAVYLREDELLHDLATTLGRGSGEPLTPAEVPDLLRTRKITVVCTRTHRTMTHDHHGGTQPPMG
jgi:site-specific DNA recombinase